MQAALDMQSGIVLDPMAEFKALGQHPDPGDEGAIGVTGLTLSVKKGKGKAAYAPACTDTDAVGMACEQVTGLHLLSLLCSPLVCCEPAIEHEAANLVAVLAATHSSILMCCSAALTSWRYTMHKLM